MTDVGGQGTEGRGQMTEDRYQKTENRRIGIRRQMSEDGGQMPEDRCQEAEIRFIVTECGLRPVGAMGAYAPEGSGNAESVGSQNSHRHTQTHTDIFHQGLNCLC